MPDCDRPASRRALCASHYDKWREAKVAGTLELGKWRLPLKRGHKKGGVVLHRVRVPDFAVAHLAMYAETRALSMQEAAAELVTRFFAGTWQRTEPGEGLSPQPWRRVQSQFLMEG